MAMSSVSEPSSTPTRSIPVGHAALDSWLRSGSWPCQNEETKSNDTVGGKTLHVSKEVQTYFQQLESRQCRTSSVGPAHTLRIEQRLSLVRSDGQDSGIEDLGMTSPSSPRGPDGGTRTLAQKEFMVYRRALLCAQFPVLSAPQPTSSPHPPSPYAYPLSPPIGTHSGSSHFTYLASRNPQARLTPDKVSLAEDYGMDGQSDEESEEEVLVQNEMLASLVRKAFELNEERHRYYDEVITEGMSHKAPARILIEELVSRLSIVENNRHPFYHPQAFEPRAYDVWQQDERRHISELIEIFWQFSLPSPASSMVKPSYWQTVHEEYRDVMVRLIRLDKRQGVSYSASMLTSTSRRLLKEFGLRYGVGELYRRIVFLEYIANKDHFECDVWYMEMILKELSRLSLQLPATSHQARFIMVKHEFELLQDVLSKLHEHSKHGLQGLLHSLLDSSQKAVALVSLLSSVLNLKTQLTGRKGSSLEHYLEGYARESAKQAYHRHKLRLETELNINTYVGPITAELVTKLTGCAQEDVRRCLEYYRSVFGRYKLDIVNLAATTFYSDLMTDVNLVCEMSDINKEMQGIDQELLALAQKLSELDAVWRDYIPRQAQQWRQPMLVKAKTWLKTMTKQLTHLVVNVVNTDEFRSDFGKDTSPSEQIAAKPRPHQSSILRRSPFSAFTAVSSSVEVSPDRVRGPKVASVLAGQTEVESKSSKPSRDIGNQKKEAKIGADLPDSVLYLNASSKIKRIQSMPDITCHETENTGLRRNATMSDIQQDDTSASQIRFQDVGTGVVSFSSMEHLEHKDQGLSSVDSEAKKLSFSKEADIGIQRPESHSRRLSEAGSNTSSSDMPRPADDDTTTLNYNNGALEATQTENPTTTMESVNNNNTEEDSSRTHVPPAGQIIPEISPGPETDSISHQSISTHLVTTDSPEIEILTESRTTDLAGKSMSKIAQVKDSSEQTTPVAMSSTCSRAWSSSVTSSSRSTPRDQTTTLMTGSKNRSSSVSFKSKHLESSKPESSRPDGFSSSLVDVMFMTQRIIGFMQKLIGILCPADIEVSVGPDGDFTRSLSVRTFWERVKMMKLELKEITEGAIIKVVCLYVNNLLAMDLCATQKDQVESLVDGKVVYGVLFNRQESMLSRCRHESESNIPCNYYMNRDAALLCDKHEPITQQMCVRINNTWSILCLLPKLESMLQSRLRGCPPSSLPSEDDQHPNRIYDEPMDHGDIDGSSLAHGDHSMHLHNALQAQIHLLAYKLNLILYEALHVLLSPEFDNMSIADRLQPLTSCLHDHWVALDSWLTPPCLTLFMQRLWLCLVEDFEREVEGLRLMKEYADSQALLLSQSISHLIEFLHARGEGLGIDQLVKPAEVVLSMLQLHCLSSKHLIHLYQKHLLREAEADPSTEPLPRDVLQTMYQALHKQRKCFTGHHLATWLLVHYYKVQDHPASKRIKYKNKAQQVGQKLLDMSFIQHVSSQSYAVADLIHDDYAGCSSDASVTDPTPYPVVTILGVPKTSIIRQSQDLGNDSSEDNLEVSAMQHRQRHTKRRISDFYSEEMETSDDSSMSKSEEVVRKTFVLKADVHVSAMADSDEFGSKEQDTSQSAQKDLQGAGGDASSSDEQTLPLVSNPKTPPSRKSLPGASSGGDTPSSSSSSKRESSSQSAKNIKPSESKHLFLTDSQHFYYFCDIDDQLFYSVSGDFTRSLSSRDGRGQAQTAKSSNKPHPHLKHLIVNAEFVLGILLCRRKRSRVAKDFTRSIPNEFWKEEDESPCCSCFK